MVEKRQILMRLNQLIINSLNRNNISDLLAIFCYLGGGDGVVTGSPWKIASC